MRIIRKGDPDYDLAREISNARFDLNPDAIYFCDNHRDIADLICKLRNCPPRGGIRVRAGGHQHVGMSSGDGVAIIDVSEISRINFRRRSSEVWIGAGTELQTLYGAVDARRLLFPGGGCNDVHLGGLILGGGWGPYTRYLGLGCDQLKAVRIVKADGTFEEDVSDRNDPDLMWAIRGGGGGNFGIVTDFFYDLKPWPEGLQKPSIFSLRWTKRSLIADVLHEWAANFPVSDDTRLTSFCRLTLVETELDTPGDTDDVPISIGGTYIGTPEEAEALLAKLLPTTYAKRYRPKTANSGAFEGIFYADFSHIHPDYQPGPPHKEVERMARALGYDDLLGAPPVDVQSTCSGRPFPHKVSGFVPKTRIKTGQSGSGQPVHCPDPHMIETLRKIFTEEACAASKVRRYLSLHSLGGEVFTNETYRERSAFPYRDRPFLFQPQAWWADPNDPEATKEGLGFISRLREDLAPYTEGGFINFPDLDLAGPAPASRDELLLPYYGKTNLARLRKIKACVDPANLFDFPMGILPAG